VQCICLLLTQSGHSSRLIKQQNFFSDQTLMPAVGVRGATMANLFQFIDDVDADKQAMVIKTDDARYLNASSRYC